MSDRTQKTALELKRAVADWNARVEVGARVTVRMDDGRSVETVTRSIAWILGGHTAVVQVQGISGCYLLERVTPCAVVKPAEPAAAEAECAMCARLDEGGYGPSHRGSERCRCGSIASGGKKAHCACETCF